MHPFEYRSPDTLDEARAVLAEVGSATKVLAGGQSLMILLRQGLVSPEVLLSLDRIDALRRIETDEEGLVLGAMVSYHAASAAPELRSAAPILTRAAGSVGSVHIRNRGTVGGSVCHADPAGDVPTVLLALDAVANVSSVDGRWSIPLNDFFIDLLETKLTERDVLESVAIPTQPTGASFGYRRFSYREGEYPLAVAACRLAWDDGICREARVAVGGGDVSPKRLPDVEAALTGTPCTDEARRSALAIVPSCVDPIPDVRGSARWKTRVVESMVAKAVGDASNRTEAI